MHYLSAWSLRRYAPAGRGPAQILGQDLTSYNQSAPDRAMDCMDNLKDHPRLTRIRQHDKLN